MAMAAREGDYDEGIEPGDRPRRRRPEDEYEEYEDDYDRPPRLRRRPGPSGLVTAVGVINCILGGLSLIFGVIVVVAGATMLDMLTGAGRQVGAGREAGQVADMGRAVLVGMTIGLFVGGALYILGGIGVLMRQQYGRIITLILGALSGLSALCSVTGLPQTIVSILISGGYCVFVYIVLLNSEYAAEFR
jgi:hypothetical protein